MSSCTPPAHRTSKASNVTNELSWKEMKLSEEFSVYARLLFAGKQRSCEDAVFDLAELFILPLFLLS